MDTSKITSKLWRLTKVLYFITTLPLVTFGAGAILVSQEIHQGGIWVSDYYIGFLYAILFILGYLIITDILRRIISYVNNGSFHGFISYFEILKKFGLLIIIIGGIISITSFSLSQNLRNECTGTNEGFNEYGVCSCNEGFKRENGYCEITLEKSILNTLPEGSFLREIKEVPGEKGTYLGIYITNYEIDKELDTDKEMPYYTCPEQLHGQGIVGEYHIFLAKNSDFRNENIEILDDITLFNDGISNGMMNLSFLNTRYNNNLYFSGTSFNDSNKHNIELTQLLHFNDYNGDGIKNEFILKQRGGMCGVDFVTIIGFDVKNKKLINFDISGEFNKYKWGSNFYPNDKGEVINGWECGNHGADTLNRTYYKFDKQSNQYVFIKKEERECTEEDYR